MSILGGGLYHYPITETPFTEIFLFTETPSFTETPLHRDPLEGTWDQTQRPPEGTWGQAARQEVTSYNYCPPPPWTEWLTHVPENIINYIFSEETDSNLTINIVAHSLNEIKSDENISWNSSLTLTQCCTFVVILINKNSKTILIHL